MKREPRAIVQVGSSRSDGHVMYRVRLLAFFPDPQLVSLCQ